MTVLFGGAGVSNAPAEKSKSKNETSEKEKDDHFKVQGHSVHEKAVKLVSFLRTRLA